MAEEEKKDKSDGYISEGINALNEMQEGNASKLLTNFNKTNHVLKYLDVGQKNGHYMIFNIYVGEQIQSQNLMLTDDSNISGNLGSYNVPNFTSERFFDAQSKLSIT